jgi:zinc protease
MTTMKHASVTGLLAAAVMLALPLEAAAQAAPRVQLAVEEFTLPNGLHVILHRDPTTPMITTNIWYHVGSGHERPGRTGFAHLFEHIMFEGSQNVPEGAIDEWFEEAGGSPNGSTSRDRTNYMQTFSSSALDMALFIESDRMGFLLEAMTPEKVDGQRAVVKNERRQSVDNEPYGLAPQIISELLYPPDHPYSWPVIGYMDHLDAASYEDVASFFREFYAPNNATLTITGDVDPRRARALVTKWFGEIPRGAAPAPLAAAQPRLERTERVTLEDRVQLPRLYMAWHTPPAFETGDVELNVLAQVLAGGRSSRLYRRLVYEMQIADNVSANQASGRIASDFRISATARAGHTLDELERVIIEEIERIQREPPDAREIERVLNQYEASFFERLERIATKADQLNSYYFYTGRANFFNEDLARYRAVRPEAVSAAAARYLDMNRRVVLGVVPQGRVELAASNSRVLPSLDYSLSPEARRAAAAP